MIGVAIAYLPGENDMKAYMNMCGKRPSGPFSAGGRILSGHPWTNDRVGEPDVVYLQQTSIAFPT